ncbi:chemotaxis protein CheW [Phormidium sp. CCY1219]|uniref:chemotaxis protein CheW n=1 Tax=Phormidium sp. CCY1219 TaxID=2886104 RepID=UPI002D1F5EFA|nr:chemotaxis protein CheW [Phormidium sp. CCY1219]MEB3828956.1 chemotaxis protein CheW [Phormidium sp. CCY1219]
MLMLLFYVGEDRFALKCSQVVEIIPRVTLTTLHHAPEYVAGLFNYRGAIVPVIDLCHLIQGNPCRHALSTRIIIVHYPGKNNTPHLLGLMAERISDTLDRPETEFVTPGFQLDEAAYFGEIMIDEQGTIQRIEIDRLLSEQVEAFLLPASES